MRAIEAFIYRSPTLGDCSNGGISSRFDRVLIPHPEGPVEIDEGKPLPKNLCEVVRRTICGREYVHVQPHGTRASGRCAMNGGCFAYSCGGRFAEAVCNGGHPVALHDRFEEDAQ